MYKYKINLVTVSDITEFVRIAADVNGEIKLEDDSGFCVSGKSLLGAMATVEWNSLFCVSSVDVYSKIQKFCA